VIASRNSFKGITLAIQLPMKIHALCFFLLVLASVAVAAQVATQPSSPSRIALENGWHIQSACKISDGGDAISRPGYRVQDWLATTVPHTVLGAQIDAKMFPDPFFGMNLRAIPGTTYPPGKIFTNEKMPDDSPYHCSWWYRTEFHWPAQLRGKNAWIHFDGINYRANIWINGQQIATSADVAGAYRTYQFNVKDVVHAGGTNAVAVEVFAQAEDDLGINFVDWNPAPADKNLGLWRPVYITSSGPVEVRYPAVSTHFPDDLLKTAELTVTGEIENGSNQQVSGTVEAIVEHAGTVSQSVTLAAGEHKTIVFTPDQYPKLSVKNPEIWWPYPFGAQALGTIQMRFVSNGAVSDTAHATFGIREITSEMNPEGHLLFRVNHRKILIRGGGWSPDMFLRINDQRMRDELRQVRNLGLNTIRLEGKIETDEFFDLTDRMGILVMAGWCCCDHWEHWSKWQPQDHEISKASLASQIQRLRNHASLLVWLNGSDNPPPVDVETDYIAVLKQYHWPNPYISSASATPTTVTGPSGVKMSGPYDYVPPSYWLRDPGRWGGAYGFNSETSPGPAPPLAASLKRFIPAQNLWPHDDVWNFHAGGGSFTQTNIFDNAMAVTYGPAVSSADYEKKAQAMTYDGERAMFEAYARNKYNSTGVIQWMLNNAWPSVIWHLYDYYLVPGGGYFGAKKANELLHAQYSYDDRSVVVVNSLYEPRQNLQLKVRVLNLDLTEKFSQTANVNSDPDSATRVLTIPDIDGLSNPYFVRLDLSDSSAKIVSTNFYWVPLKLAEFDWEKSTFFHTPAQYEDMTQLSQLPQTTVEWSTRVEHRAAGESIEVNVRNTGKSLAFLVHASIHTRAGDEIAPVLWDDNYLFLLPGESRTISASVQAHHVKGADPIVSLDGWNIRPEQRRNPAATRASATGQ
jgi:exo-1,4-beta-D-glucosaminidase